MRKVWGWITTLVVAVICTVLGGYLQDFLAPRLAGLQDSVDSLPWSGGMVWPYLIVVWTLMIIIPLVMMARRRARWRRDMEGTRPLSDTEPD